MREYKFIDHTADIALEIKADSIEELFIAVFEGWKEVSVGKSFIPEEEKISLSLKSFSLDELLVSFAGEINYLLIAKRWLTGKIKDIKTKSGDSGWELKVSLLGKVLSDDELIIQREIKAATYHMSGIEKISNEYKAVLVFDV